MTARPVRRPRVRTVAVVAVSALLGGCTAATADDSAAPPGLTDSAELDGPVVAAGVVLDPAGSPAPPGELVLLDAWPRDEVLAETAPGDAVESVTVGVARTGDGGTFELRIADDDALDSRYTDESGLVDLQVHVLAEDWTAVWSFSAAPASPGTENLDLRIEAVRTDGS